MDCVGNREKGKCCGCGLCQYICPVQAIDLKIGADGASYPVVNEDQCLKCGKCIRECIFETRENGSLPRKVYAAALKDEKTLLASASGGAFYAFAVKIIKQNGIVYGAAYSTNEKGLNVKHKRVSSLWDLTTLQGSKYAQSSIVECFQAVLADIKTGRQVLFSGTPCQIAAIKRFLKSEYDNFHTIEIICHGTPGGAVLTSYSSYLNKRLGGQVKDIRFRDKSRGWGFNARIIFEKNGKRKEFVLPGNLSSYYYFFLHWDILRESCYSCKYANVQRCADITIGDYNGIQIVHPEFLKQNGGPFIENNGISCVLVNSLKGETLFSSVRNEFKIVDSDFENAVKYNEQLHSPCKPGKNRHSVCSNYKNDEWESIRQEYKKILGYKYYKQLLSELIRYRFN